MNKIFSMLAAKIHWILACGVSQVELIFWNDLDELRLSVIDLKLGSPAIRKPRKLMFALVFDIEFKRKLFIICAKIA